MYNLPSFLIFLFLSNPLLLTYLHLPSDTNMNLTLLIDYFDIIYDTHPEPERMFLSHLSPTPAQSTRLQKGEKTNSHIKSLVPNLRISPRFANDEPYVLDRQETVTIFFIKTTRRTHRSLMTSPRPDLGHYLDIALKNASKSSRQLYPR